MDIDNALRRFHMSVGGVHVHVGTVEGSQIVRLNVGNDTVELSGMNELLTAIDLLGRVAYEARRMVEDAKEDSR